MAVKFLIVVLLISSTLSLPAEEFKQQTEVNHANNLSNTVQVSKKVEENDNTDLKTDASMWWNNYYRYSLNNRYYYMPSAYSYYTPVYNRWNYNYNWETIPLPY